MREDPGVSAGDVAMKLAEVRRNVPRINVFRSKNGEKSSLAATEMDDRYDQKPYSEGYTEGDGSKANPYTYKSAAPVSPHYIIVDLWLKYRSQQCYISVNQWLLQVTPEGVIAEDGTFTRLLPENK